MYNLHSNDLKGCKNLWVVISILNFIIFVGVWIFIHFAISWLHWEAFKNVWWLGPETLVVEFLWEVIVDIPHVLIADALNKDKRTFTKCRGQDRPEFRKLIERCVANNVILTFLGGF